MIVTVTSREGCKGRIESRPRHWYEVSGRRCTTEIARTNPIGLRNRASEPKLRLGNRANEAKPAADATVEIHAVIASLISPGAFRSIDSDLSAQSHEQEENGVRSLGVSTGVASVPAIVTGVRPCRGV
jgi:hypothetical protein